MSIATFRSMRLMLLPLLWLLAAHWALALEVPFLSGRVSDQAQMLTEEGIARITQTLAGLEADTGAQVAILTLPSLEGESLEDYSLRVAETWALGQAGKDDGVLLLIARDDHKLRIEVGYGLEGVLPDATCRRIIDGLMVPAFKNGDFEGGIDQAVNTINALVRGESPDAIQALAASPSDTPETVMGLLVFVGVFGLILLPFVLVALSIKGSQAWILYLFLSPFFFSVPQPFGETAGIIVLVAWLVGFPILRSIWPKEWQVEPSSNSSGGSGSSWSSSSSSSSSSFSGGGGSFGGGGASGSW